MQKFTPVNSRIIPLPMKNVDTDMIIPAGFMTSVSREGYGQNLFRRLRDQDPNFPFNLEKYKGAQILAADENFGCGSSREHAVWALCSWGIRAVIAKSFADIFHGNAGKNGLALIKLPEQVVDQILREAQEGDCYATIDLESQTVTLSEGSVHSFDYDPFVKHCLLSGLDDIDYIRSHQDKIDVFRGRRIKQPSFCKFVYS
ncbi:MAG: 3-isopropylmalate dehydratase small subunit [Deltaproteobacteria bacterium]|nr:3-isopropylmalate dehydratase small subunit [Deltaproteobacteria bacterium]